MIAAQENRFKPDSHKLRYLASREDLRTKADRLHDILYNWRMI